MPAPRGALEVGDVLLMQSGTPDSGMQAAPALEPQRPTAERVNLLGLPRAELEALCVDARQSSVPRPAADELALQARLRSDFEE